MVILDQESPTVAIEDDGDGGGSHWSFLCIQCVGDWRERGPRRGGVSTEQVLETLVEEYSSN